MKQVSLRMADDLHALLVAEADLFNRSLNQHLLELVCQRGDLYTTNLNNKIQIRFSSTHLGDLLVLGQRSSFDGLYNIMVESISKGYEVIIERQSTNYPPFVAHTFTDINELQKWRNDMLSIK